MGESLATQVWHKGESPATQDYNMAVVWIGYRSHGECECELSQTMLARHFEVGLISMARLGSAHVYTIVQSKLTHAEPRWLGYKCLCERAMSGTTEYRV